MPFTVFFIFMLFYMNFPMPGLLPNTLLPGSPCSTLDSQPVSHVCVYKAFQNLPGKINAPFFMFLYHFVHTSILTQITPFGNYSFLKKIN